MENNVREWWDAMQDHERRNNWITVFNENIPENMSDDSLDNCIKIIYNTFLEYKCNKCGKVDRSCNPDTFREGGDIRNIMEEMKICFTCAFWYHQFKLDQDEYRFPIIVDGCHYVDGGRVDKKTGGFVGYGGAEWNMKMLATGEIRSTNNLWHQGNIPECFKDMFPDNAVFIKEEEIEITL